MGAGYTGRIRSDHRHVCARRRANDQRARLFHLAAHVWGELSLSQYLAVVTATAKLLKKAYFVGEWGGNSENGPEYYGGIGNAFVDASVQLVLLWNFNAVEGSVEYSFSAESERGKMLLELVAQMNARYGLEYR